MARWEKFGGGEILISTVRYLDHEDEQECELEMVLLEDARRGLAEEVARIRRELRPRFRDCVVDATAQDAVDRLNALLDLVCPKEPSDG